MRGHLCALSLCALLATAAEGQSVLGTFSAVPAPGRAPVTLVLKKDAQGKIVGTLSGNGTSYAVEGALQGEDVAGTLSGGGMRSYFEARREGATLRMIMADVGADGKPDYAHAREITLTATDAAPSPAPATAPAQAGNPLAGGAPDKFAGTFAGTDVTLALSRSGAGYAGTITYRGTTYPATARGSGDALTGSFTAGGQSYDLAIASAGDGKFVNLTTGGTTYMLARGGAGSNPLAAGASAPAGAASPLAKTAQDQQIAAFLMRNAWCSFSFSGSSTSASSGTSSSSRAVFRPDGTASEGSKSESTYSGSAGSVYGQSGNGQQARWRIENGMLMLSGDGVQWVQQTLKIADNGSGSPIVTANGKEYMVCK